MSEDFPVQLAGFRSGSLVAGYRLEAQVGAGGMAVVFRARDERLGRLVALKILAPALAADPAFRRRFIAESRAAAAVDDPHIIPIYEAGEADGALFIAMRFVGGGDLRLVLHREGALPPGRAAAFISPVASALDAAHGAGLVHRDVKPANILVDARPGRPDHVYLSDFGVSKGAISSVSLTGTGHFLGTPDYSAPEQIQGQAVDGRTDQYALACVVYQLLTGAPPFERDQGMAVLLAHLSAPPPSLGSRRPDLPSAVDQALARALAKAPEKRYGSCRDFADALREALGLAPYHSGGSAAARDHPQTEISSQPGFSRPGAAGTGKAAVLADMAVAATLDSVPGGGPADAVDLPSGAVIVTGPTAMALAEQGIPAAAATAKAAGQSARKPETPDGPGRLTREPGKPAADANGPVSTADTLTADQRVQADRGSGSESVQPALRTRRTDVHRPASMTVWVRQHRLLAIALACAVLAVAGIVPFALANSPRSPSSPGTPNSPSNSADAGSGANGSVTVRGAFGTTPSVSIPKLDADNKLFVKTVISGTGTTVTKSDSVVVNYVLYLWNGTSSSLKANTFTSSPTIIGGTLLPGLQTALTGQKVGGRVLAVIPPADGYGSSGESQLGVSGTTTLVFVVDVIAAYPANASASGTPVSDGGSSLPTVSAEPGSAPVVTIPSSSPPSTLQVRTLIKGAGPTVAKGEYVIAQYVGYIWRTQKVFGSSWSTGTPFGFTFDAQPEQVISGWDIGLAGQTVGSRVLLVIPPNDGYGSAGDSQAGITGTDTLVDVVDILGAFKSAS